MHVKKIKATPQHRASRAGIIPSVHAFSDATVGRHLLGLIIFCAAIFVLPPPAATDYTARQVIFDAFCPFGPNTGAD